MDPLLRAFTEATDEAERERALSTVIEAHALPLARAIVARKLRPYGDRPDAADREDVVAEAIVSLLERLRRANDIDDFEGYTAAVVHATCAHYVRSRYPRRARLKNRLRYVMSTSPALALWHGGGGEMLCGLAGWKGQSAPSPAVAPMRKALEEGPQSWADLRPPAMGAALLELLTRTGSPVEFETLVAAIADAAALVEPTAAEDASVIASAEVPQDVLADQRRLLRHVWDEVRELPVAQRVALLLSLRSAGGSGLLWLLPVMGVASIRQIASTLEIPHPDFARLWREMPLSDREIAARLGCTRQQVINLRMAGRKRLAHRVRHLASPVRRVSRRGANIRPVSPSLKGSV